MRILKQHLTDIFDFKEKYSQEWVNQIEQEVKMVFGNLFL